MSPIIFVEIRIQIGLPNGQLIIKVQEAGKLVNDDIKIVSFRIYSQSQIRQTSNNQTESGTNSILM